MQRGAVRDDGRTDGNGPDSRRNPPCAAQSENADVKALADEFRYSDPVSNAAIADAEADLAAAVDELQSAYVDGDSEAVAKLCRKASALLAERNRLCKLNKN